jgi:hypothetical protein
MAYIFILPNLIKIDSETPEALYRPESMCVAMGAISL